MQGGGADGMTAPLETGKAIFGQLLNFSDRILQPKMKKYWFASAQL